MSVFEFDDYKEYLRFRIGENAERRGYHAQLAKAAGCQRSFLSQVLGSDIDLTRDHAAGLCDLWALQGPAQEYFITLVDLKRARSPALKAFLTKKLQDLRKKGPTVSGQVQGERVGKLEDETVFYSSWYWTAIYTLLSIPAYQSPEAIAKRLGLPLTQVVRSLERLQKMGLIKRSGNGWSLEKKDIHLPSSSVLNELNHMNWRQRAIVDVQKQDRESVHFTAVFAIAGNDAKKLREIILNSTLEVRKQIAPSPEEELFCFNCDFFRV